LLIFRGEELEITTLWEIRSINHLLLKSTFLQGVIDHSDFFSQFFKEYFDFRLEKTEMFFTLWLTSGKGEVRCCA